jgi:hypothetical protein
VYYINMKLLTKYLFISMLLISISSQGRTYYSKASGNWSSSVTWSTVSHTSSTNSGSFPSANDTAYVAGGFTVTLNATLTTNTVYVGFNGSTGTLEYSNAATVTLTVSNLLSVSDDGIFRYNSSSPSGRTQQLIIYNTLINTGSMDFDYDANDFVYITFSGSVNSTVSGRGTFDLKTILLNKSSVNYSVTILSTTFEPAIKTFSAFTGKWIHNNSSTFDINPSSNFQINSSVIVEVPMGTVKFASSNTQLTLLGTLIVDGGNVTVGSSTGTAGIRTDASGSVIPAVTITSGSMTVNGGITFKSGSGSKAFKFTMDGGTLLLHSGTIGSSAELLKVTDVAGSEFNMSAGTIRFQKPNLSGGSSIDFDVCGLNGTVNVTGGELQFGTTSTASGANFNFKPYAAVTLPGVVVSGQSTSGTSLCPSNASNNTDTMRFLYLEISQGCTFDHRSFSGAVGDDKPLVLTADKNGTAFYNAGTYNMRTGIIEFAGINDQVIDGSGAQTFTHMVMNSTSTVTLNQMLTITSSLTLTSGLIISDLSTYPVLASGSITTVGSDTSYISGPMMYQMSSTGPLTLNFPIGLDGKWRPNVVTATHNSAALALYFVQLVNSPASALPYILPLTLSRVSSVRYYQFVRTGASNFSTATMKIYYGDDDGVTEASTLRVAQASGIDWYNQGGTGTANTVGTITSASMSTFTSIYALGNSTGGVNPLPVELTSFTAVKKNKAVELNWTTASEINNDHFEILRSSDGVIFETIGQLKGRGNSTKDSEYSFTDSRPIDGYNFYRLKQVDFDGAFTESLTRAVNFINSEIMVYPSVSDGKNVHLRIPGGYADSNVKIYSTEGKVVMDATVEIGKSDILLPELSKGSYRALVRVNGEEMIRSLIVVN